MLYVQANCFIGLFFIMCENDVNLTSIRINGLGLCSVALKTSQILVTDGSLIRSHYSLNYDVVRANS